MQFQLAKLILENVPSRRRGAKTMEHLNIELGGKGGVQAPIQSLFLLAKFLPTTVLFSLADFKPTGYDPYYPEPADWRKP